MESSLNFFNLISSKPIPLGWSILSPSTKDVHTDDPIYIVRSEFLVYVRNMQNVDTCDLIQRSGKHTADFL